MNGKVISTYVDHMRVWNIKTRVKGKEYTYRRYVFVIPKEIAELLDKSKKYRIIIEEVG